MMGGRQQQQLLALLAVLSLAMLALLAKLHDAQHTIASLERQNDELHRTLEHSLTESYQDLERHRQIASTPHHQPESVKTPPPTSSQSTSSSIPFDLRGKARLVTYMAVNSGRFARPQCDTDRLYSMAHILAPPAQAFAASPFLSCKIKGLVDGPFGSGAHCWGRRLVLDARRVRLTARGGEDVLSVMGRREADENPAVLPGALTADGGAVMDCDVGGEMERHARQLQPADTLHGLLQSLCPPQSKRTATSSCSSWDDTPTVLVHRFEYSNLYHTATELLSALVSVNSATEAGLVREGEPVRVVFLDGHAKGTLDDLWAWVFSRGTLPSLRVGQLSSTPMLCLSRVILAETGYAAEINLHPRDGSIFNPSKLLPHQAAGNKDWCVMSEAQELGRRMAELAVASPPPPPSDGQRRRRRVVFIARDSAATPAHPRVARHGKPARSITNVDALQAKAEEMTRGGDDGVEVLVAQMSILSLAEQVALVRSADVIISVHGAALMHLVWARQGSLVIELAPGSYLGRIHFPKAAARAGAAAFVRLSSLGDFLHMAGGEEGTVQFTPDMLERVVGWSLLPSVDARLAAV